jgi:agmatinase
MIDPLERWAQYGEKPDYAGLLTFAGCPYTQDPAELEGFDVAVVGAPMDELVSDRPGARFAPRAIRAASCPPGPHLEAKVDAFSALRVVDFGDAPIIPADPAVSHAAIAATVGQVLAAGALPVTLGGDHSVTKPCVEAVAAARGPVGVVHFDTHTDTGAEVFGVRRSHGTFMKELLDDGHVFGARYAQIGLRGYWPGEPEFSWQAGRGVTSFFAHDVPVYLTVDVDVLDPAFLPGGTGTPEPGGLSATELLLGVRLVASQLELVGLDVVEVIPTAVGSADSSALVAERVVREALTGIALRRSS